MQKLFICTALLMLTTATTTMAGDSEAIVIPWFNAPSTIRIGKETLQPFQLHKVNTTNEYQIWAKFNTGQNSSVCTKRVNFPKANEEYIVELQQDPQYKRACLILAYPLESGSPKAKQLKQMLQSK